MKGKTNNSGNDNTTPNTLTVREVLAEFVRTDDKVKDFTGKVEDIRSSRSGHLLQLAKQYGKLETFLQACHQAEQDLIVGFKIGPKTYKAEKPPRSWINAKSNIKGAMERDMDLSKYDTESELRKDLTKARKAEKEAEEQSAPNPLAGIEVEIGLLYESIANFVAASPDKGLSIASTIVREANKEVQNMLKDIVKSEPVKQETETDEEEDEAA